MTNDEGSVPAAPAEREWWDDPKLPWRREPGRSDYLCLTAISVVGLYQLIMLPLRPVMIGLAPHLLGSLGYRTGFVMTGALAATGDTWWPIVLAFGSLMAVKFDWVYWWAGRLWGHGLIDVWSGQSARQRKRNERAIRLTQRYASLAIVLTYLPLPIPAGVIYAALGAAGTTFGTFMAINLVSAAVSTGIYIFLGYLLGAPAVALVNAYSQWLWYASLVILAGMLAAYWWRGYQQRRASAQ